MFVRKCYQHRNTYIENQKSILGNFDGFAIDCFGRCALKCLFHTLVLLRLFFIRGHFANQNRLIILRDVSSPVLLTRLFIVVCSVDHVLQSSVLSAHVHPLLLIRVNRFLNHMTWNLEFVGKWLVESRQMVLVLYHSLCVDIHRARLQVLPLIGTRNVLRHLINFYIYCF